MTIPESFVIEIYLKPFFAPVHLIENFDSVYTLEANSLTVSQSNFQNTYTIKACCSPKKSSL